MRAQFTCLTAAFTVVSGPWSRTWPIASHRQLNEFGIVGINVINFLNYSVHRAFYFKGVRKPYSYRQSGYVRIIFSYKIFSA